MSATLGRVYVEDVTGETFAAPPAWTTDRAAYWFEGSLNVNVLAATAPDWVAEQLAEWCEAYKAERRWR